MSTDIETEVAVCTIKDIGLEVTGKDAQPLIDSLNDYFATFAKPVKRESGTQMLGHNECLKCGTPLDGMVGSFTWDICHGEGKCSNCGWPARAYHDPKNDEGSIFTRPFECILQYHPDHVTTKD